MFAMRLPEPLVSYCDPLDTLPRRALIRTVEWMSGQPRLQRLYRDWRAAGAGECVWHSAVRRLGIRVLAETVPGAAIPMQGPVVVVANHPFGVIDGICLGSVLAPVRPDFLLVAHNALRKAPEFRPFIIPIDFLGDAASVRINLESRCAALAHLRRGGVVVVFPAGRVSTAQEVFGKAIDSEWKPFVATLVRRSRAAVVPVFFEGQNSWLFHLMSRLGDTWREAILMHEAVRRIGTEVRLRIGRTLQRDRLDACASRRALVELLRAETYALAQARGAPWSPATRAVARVRATR